MSEQEEVAAGERMARTIQYTGRPRTPRMCRFGVTGLILYEHRTRVTMFGRLSFNVPPRVGLWLTSPSTGWFRLVLTIFVRLAAAAAGVGVMYLESRYQPTPGIGFGLGLVLILGAVLPWRNI